MNDMENGGGRLGTLHGQRVIVMGGSSGIGLAVAHAALRAGADVTVVSSQLARIEKALEFLGSAAQGCAVDLASEAAIERYFRTSGRFDHLVYTAGDSLRLLPLAEADLSDVRSAFNLRYWGALAAAKHSASRLRDGGSITLTSGIASRRPRAGWVFGASVCGAVEALTRALAVELAPLRVNAVAPGLVATELWREMPEPARRAMYQQAGDALPVGRVGSAEDIAAAYLFLMSSGFATGQTHVVDGGAVLV